MLTPDPERASGQAGGSLRGLKLVPSKWRCLVPPTSPHQGATRRVPITAPVKCGDKTLVVRTNRVQNKICRSRLCASGRFFVA